jgi:hypothetical protein
MWAINRRRARRGARKSKATTKTRGGANRLRKRAGLPCFCAQAFSLLADLARGVAKLPV